MPALKAVRVQRRARLVPEDATFQDEVDLDAQEEVQAEDGPVELGEGRPGHAPNPLQGQKQAMMAVPVALTRTPHTL